MILLFNSEANLNRIRAVDSQIVLACVEVLLFQNLGRHPAESRSALVRGKASRVGSVSLPRAGSVLRGGISNQVRLALRCLIRRSCLFVKLVGVFANLTQHVTAIIVLLAPL